MDRNEPADYRYWRYYLSLEDDFIRTIRFVELCEENFDVHSIEYTRLLVSICAEIETILKQICIENKIYKILRKKKDKNENIKIEEANINEIKAKIIQIKGYHFDKMSVAVVNYNLKQIRPFKNWSTESTNFSDWWTAYNKIKHDREKNYPKATMKYVLEALAGLFISELFLFEAKYGSSRRPSPIPKLIGLEYFPEPMETEGGKKSLTYTKPIF